MKSFADILKARVKSNLNKAYKFRIYPDNKQEELLAKTFGCCLFINNIMLELHSSKQDEPSNESGEWEYSSEKRKDPASETEGSEDQETSGNTGGVCPEVGNHKSGAFRKILCKSAL